MQHFECLTRKSRFFFVNPNLPLRESKMNKKYYYCRLTVFFKQLVRRIIRQTFEMCRRQSWDEEWTQSTAKVIETILLDPKTSLGFSLHVTELYMEELAKIGRGGIPPSIVTELLRPFAVHLAAMEDERQIRHVMKHIFRYLIFQSDVGMDYMEKFEAWRQVS